VIRAVRKSGAAVNYYAFDLLYANGRDLRSLPLLERKKRLRKLIPSDVPNLAYVDFIETEGELLYRHAASIGMEGIVAKQAESQYIGGRRREWLKSKPAGTHDGWERPRRHAHG
jgi:bifunctional non-homologous end joining protein LigD